MWANGMFRRTMLAAGAGTLAAIRAWSQPLPTHLPHRPAPPGPPAVAGASLFGIYKGAGATGAANMQDWVKWAGRAPDLMLDFNQFDTAQNMINEAGWQMSCWAGAGVKRVSLTFGLACNDTSLASAATGSLDASWHAIAQACLSDGYGDAILRPGHEFNGGWFPWHASGNETNYKAAFRRCVQICRAVSPNFKFDWCATVGNNQPVDCNACYPGDDVVDIIGTDLYPSTWLTGGSKTEADVWAACLGVDWGLNWQLAFATQHGKQMSLPEWGIGDRPGDGHSVGDMPGLMTKMLAWIDGHNYAYTNYWDYNASDCADMVSSGERPLEGAVLKAWFQARKPL
jgi:Glycosyl hydrolase family 26